MNLVSEQSGLPGVLIIKPRVFEDDRGFFMETYQADRYSALSIPAQFVQDNHSHSKRRILRGLHYQLKHPQAKLVYVITGEIFDVAVDIRRGSPTFGQWFGTILSAENHQQMFVPEGFAHGFYVLSECADVMYKCSDVYRPNDEFGLLWSDRGVGIDWPLRGEPIVSGKDACFSGLNDIPPEHLPLFK